MNTWLLGLLGKFILGFNIDAQYYTTSMAVDDLDEVRQALGYDKINLFGYSYGATVAQQRSIICENTPPGLTPEGRLSSRVRGCRC